MRPDEDRPGQATKDLGMSRGALRSELERVATWAQFHERLRSPIRSRVACRLGGELFPFSWSPVDGMALLVEARADANARILRQEPGETIDLGADLGETIRLMPPEDAAQEPYLHLSLFDLNGLRAPGGALHRLDVEVIRPMERLWRERGFAWEGEFWPILFLGGSRSATNYHIDPTPNVTFHLFGAKRFHSLKEPDRWCPRSVKDAYLETQTLAVRPSGITENDMLVHENAPGDLVFIPRLTPHWVNAGSFSGTITFAFRGCE
jgi:hypothetical protein